MEIQNPTYSLSGQAPGNCTPIHKRDEPGQQIPPVDAYGPGTGLMKNVARDAQVIFDDTASRMAEAQKLLDQLNFTADTGQLEWDIRDKESSLLDFRIIDDKVHTLAEGRNPDAAIMKKLDEKGKVLWEDSIPAGRIEKWHGCSITSRGEFLFQSREDGCLYFLHQRREGEDEVSVGMRLLAHDDIMDEFRADLAEEREEPTPPEKHVLDMDGFVSVDGIKISKSPD